MIVPRYGMGDDTGVTSPLDLSISQIGSMVPGFLSQTYNNVPLWILAGGAFLLTWWLFFPHGSAYREEKRKLKARHTGSARLQSRGKKIRSAFS